MKEYGRKPYLGKSYYEMIGRSTQKDRLTLELYKKSEFEKPYLAVDQDEGYAEMQHFYPQSKQPDWDWPKRPLVPSAPGGDQIPKWRCMLSCDGDIGRCSGANNYRCDNVIGWCQASLTSIGSFGSWSVSGSPYKLVRTGRENPNFKRVFLSLDSIEVYPDWNNIPIDHVSNCNAWKEAKFLIRYEDSEGHICRGEIKVSCCIQCACPGGITYNSGNPTTIGQSSEVTITVDAGCPPYTWGVSGTGFSFADAETDTGSNILQTNADACGPGNITVTDCCSETGTGSVRCTTGQWVEKSSGTCVLDGAYTDTISSTQHERIAGYQKQYQEWGHACGQTTGGHPEYGCAELCQVGSACPPTACSDTEKGCLDSGCSVCLTGDDVPEMGCNDAGGEFGGCNVDCIKNLIYYEWECPA